MGRIAVDVMASTPQDRVQQLSEKIQAAAVQNQTWFLEQVKNAKPGEPVPYHARLGVTEDEYKEYLVLIANPNPIRKAATTTLTVEKVAENRYRLNGGDQLPYLTGIVADFAKGIVLTPLGKCDSMFVVHASQSQRLTGSFNGYQWIMRSGNLDWIGDAKQASFTSVRFILGCLTHTGRGILYYKAREVILGEVRSSSEVMLTFDLRAPERPPSQPPPTSGEQARRWGAVESDTPQEPLGHWLKRVGSSPVRADREQV